MDKPRVVKDYEKLEEQTKEMIKLEYPEGFEDHLITFRNAQGEIVSALPFETEEKYYLVRMTRVQAQNIIEDDDDYDDDGNLFEDVRQEYQDKHDDEFDGEGEDNDSGEDED